MIQACRFLSALLCQAEIGVVRCSGTTPFLLFERQLIQFQNDFGQEIGAEIAEG